MPVAPFIILAYSAILSVSVMVIDIKDRVFNHPEQTKIEQVEQIDDNSTRQ